VRSKLLARKLGYYPQHAQHSPGSSSNGSRGAGRDAEHQIEDLMLAAVLTAPEGLGSWQQRAAVEALIDQHLDQLVRNKGVASGIWHLAAGQGPVGSDGVCSLVYGGGCQGSGVADAVWHTCMLW
jgi:hypothetical protein